ncbi:MAG: hypothetical protein ACYCW6_24070 [Candidatus Xenobia bacterium]
MLLTPQGHYPTDCPIVESYLRRNGVWAALESDTKHEFLCHRFVQGGAQRPAYLVRLEGQCLPSVTMVPRTLANLFVPGPMKIARLSSHWKIQSVAGPSWFDARAHHLAEFRGWYIRADGPWICLKPPTIWEIPGPDQIVNLLRQARALMEALL